MDTEVPSFYLNIEKRSTFRYFWARVASSFVLVLAVSSAIVFGPLLYRPVMELVDPAFFDPRYENFGAIKVGMTTAEVNELLGAPKTSQYSKWGGVVTERWEGTRGVIVVSYRLLNFDGQWTVVKTTRE
jgi:hypothetical protein